MSQQFNQENSHLPVRLNTNLMIKKEEPVPSPFVSRFNTGTIKGTTQNFSSQMEHEIQLENSQNNETLQNMLAGQLENIIIEDNPPRSPLFHTPEKGSQQEEEIIESPRKPRKKKILLIIFIIICLLMLIALGPILYFVLRSSSSYQMTTLDSLLDPAQTLILRDYKPGYYQQGNFELTTQILMNVNGTMTVRNSSQNYTFTAYSSSLVSGVSVKFDFVLSMQGNELDFESENSTLTRNLDSFTNETFEFVYLQLVSCDVEITGQILSCTFPSYLQRSDYQLMLTIIQNYLPNLNKSAYGSTRRILSTVGSSSQSYSYSFDLNSMTVQLSSTMRDGNFSELASGNNSFQVSSNVVMNAISGEPLYTSINSEVSFNDNPNDEKVLISNASSKSQIAQTLKPSQAVSSNFIKLVSKFYSVVQTYSHFNPLTNLSALNDFFSNQTTNTSRLLAGSKIISTTSFTLFQKSMLGFNFDCKGYLTCYDNDKCSLDVYTDFMDVKTHIFSQEINSTATTTALKLAYTKTATLSNIQNATSILGNITSNLNKTFYDFQISTKSIILAHASIFLNSLIQVNNITASMGSNYTTSGVDSTFASFKAGLDNYYTALYNSASSMYSQARIDLPQSNTTLYNLYVWFNANITDAGYIDGTFGDHMLSFFVTGHANVNSYCTEASNAMNYIVSNFTNFISTYAALATDYKNNNRLGLSFDINLKTYQVMKTFISEYNATYFPTLTSIQANFSAFAQPFGTYIENLKSNLNTTIISKTSTTLYDATLMDELIAYYPETLYTVKTPLTLSNYAANASQLANCSSEFNTMAVSWGQRFLNILNPSSATLYNIEYLFSALSVNSLEATFKSNFQAYNSTFVSRVANNVSLLNSTTQDLLSKCNLLTSLIYEPNVTEIRRVGSSINLYNDNRNITTIFNSYQLYNEIFVNITNNTVIDMTAYFDTLMASSKEYLIGNHTALINAYEDLETRFGIYFGLNTIDFDFTYTFCRLSVISFNTQYFTTITNQYRIALGNISANLLTPLLNIKGSLSTKINQIFSSNSSMRNISNFPSSTMTLCHPTSPVSMCVNATFNASLYFLNEFSSIMPGKVVQKIIPFGSVDASFKGSANAVSMNAIMEARGNIFQGNFSIENEVGYLNGIDSKLIFRESRNKSRLQMEYKQQDIVLSLVNKCLWPVCVRNTLAALGSPYVVSSVGYGKNNFSSILLMNQSYLIY